MTPKNNLLLDHWSIRSVSSDRVAALGHRHFMHNGRWSQHGDVEIIGHSFIRLCIETADVKRFVHRRNESFVELNDHRVCECHTVWRKLKTKQHGID